MTDFKYPPDYHFHKQHLIDVHDYSMFDIQALLEKAAFLEHMPADEKSDYQPLKGKTQINLFFENSTRTQSSFELAGKRLGAHVVNMSLATSSVKKGETLKDTIVTLRQMQADLFVVRHADSGAANLIASYLPSSHLVNAGDGTHAHPSQALLDSYTIWQKLGAVARKTIVICGDILHSRVARSNIILLLCLGARVRLVAPPTLLPQEFSGFGVEISHDFNQALQGADIVMMLRVQSERMNSHFIPSLEEYYHFYGLTVKRLETYAPNAFVMHPGPVNRGVEIEAALVEHPTYSLIQEQVKNGLFVRMAILEMLCKK